MAIVQISKIVHRTGANVDLPQLDIGEIGFSTDTRQLYIGNDPVLHPAPGPDVTTQTEILTDSSTIDFSRISGAANSTIDMANVEPGQLIVASNVANVMTWTNAGGNADVLVTLGNASNVKLTGGTNGYVLQTDGTGNLTWTTNGVLRYGISTVSKANPAVVTTTAPHLLGTGTSVTIYDVFNGTAGMLQLLTSGNPIGSSRYYAKRLSDTTFSLYTDSALLTSLDSSGFDTAVANTGYVLGSITPSGTNAPGNANTTIQFNDGGGFMGSSSLTFNKNTNNANLSGNLNISTGKLYGNTSGAHNGTVGATAPNSGAFTSITATTTIIATGNITGNNIIAGSNGTGNNYKVGDDAYIGDINVSNTIRIKGVEDPANAYIVFGNSDTKKLGRAGTGPLTYNGDFTANNITTSNVNLNTWSIFANVDGLFATDGVDIYPISLGNPV